MVELIAVFELEPVVFATQPRSSPAPSPLEDPAAWDGYWRAALRDRGIESLDPIRPSGWLVSVADVLEREALNAIVDVHLEQSALYSDDGPGPFSGGFVLRTSDGASLEPTCCGDLSNIEEWRAAAEWTSPEFRTIWIGHPCIHVRAQGDRLEVSSPADDAPSADVAPYSIIDRTALESAVTRAQRTLEALSEKLRRILLGHPSTAHIDPRTIAGLRR